MKHLGKGHQYGDAITIEHNICKNGMVIRPRSFKTKCEQTERTRGMAEVFTPSWVRNVQNNLIDEAWFGRSNVFNIVDDAHHTWITNSEKITSPDKNMEVVCLCNKNGITCGEAPYLVSR